MKNKTLVIGDIHGQYDELMQMMSEHHRKGERVIFLGDYVDRGPDSKLVLDQLMKWEKEHPDWIFLKGNHEQLMVDGLEQMDDMLNPYGKYKLWIYNGGDTTRKSFGEPVDGKYVDWMKSLSLSYYDEGYKLLFVHAGIKPRVPRQEQTEKDMLWIREEFIDYKGEFYDHVNEETFRVVFGHTPNEANIGEPILMDNKTGLDGAVCPPSQKNLLALRLPEYEILSVKNILND